jgi:hypothetical protein
VRDATVLTRDLAAEERALSSELHRHAAAGLRSSAAVGVSNRSAPCSSFTAKSAAALAA